MWNYTAGVIAVIFQAMLSLMIGRTFRKNDSDIQLNFITGYIINGFLTAVFGMAAQILNFQWSIYAVGMTVIIGGLIVYAAAAVIKKKIVLTKEDVLRYVKENYVLYITALLMTLICMLSYNAHWFGNHLDDGFYLNKVAIYPYVDHPFRTNPSTGFAAAPAIAYVLNTHEMEAAFYSYIFHIVPTLYTRVFLSCYHYFLMANVVQFYAHRIMKNMNVSDAAMKAQYASAIMVLFVANPVFMYQAKLSSFQDSSFTVTGMWYGSSISRCFGMILLLAPFLEETDLSLKTVISVIIISIVLISKSTIAATVIILAALSYVFALWIIKNKKTGLPAIAAFCAVSFLLYLKFGIQEDVEIAAWNHLKTNTLRCWLLWLPVCGIALSFLWKNRFINKVNLIIILYGLFMIIPGINYFPARISSYIFVITRAFAGWMYCVYITAFIYLLIWLNQKTNTAFIQKGSLVLASLLLIFDMVTMKIAGGSFWTNEDGTFTGLSMKTQFAAVYRNPEFAPQAVTDLGDTLKRLEKETGEDLYIVCQELVNDYGATFALAIQLKQFVQDAYVVSATYRYGSPDYSEFKTYNQEEQMYFEAFNANPDHTNTVGFGRILDKYPVNTVVMRTGDAETEMFTFGFDLYEVITNPYSEVTYYVYYRNE